MSSHNVSQHTWKSGRIPYYSCSLACNIPTGGARNVQPIDRGSTPGVTGLLSNVSSIMQVLAACRHLLQPSKRPLLLMHAIQCNALAGPLTADEAALRLTAPPMPPMAPMLPAPWPPTAPARFPCVGALGRRSDSPCAYLQLGPLGHLPSFHLHGDEAGE